MTVKPYDIGALRTSGEKWGMDVDKIARDMHLADDRFVLDYDINPRARFHLDATKIAFHGDRVAAWKRGERIAPITVDMALTQKCAYACTFCYADLQQFPSAPNEWDVYANLLDDFVEIGHKPGEGVRAVSLVSDGESTESPHLFPFIRRARENGIDIALGTNGWKLPHEELPGVVDALTYLRININAAEPEAYRRIMMPDGMPQVESDKRLEEVLGNIREAVRLKRERGTDVTIGLQMVLMPEYFDQVIPLAMLGRELGVDYFVIKHCSDDEQGSLGVDYAAYKSPVADWVLHAAEALSTPDYSVQAKWSKMRTGRDRKYSKCFGTPFQLQISGSSIVAPCGSFFHDDYKRFHIGDFSEERFRDIWASDRYWEVIGHLGSDAFDPRKECATLCLQDQPNEVLFALVEEGVELTDVSELRTPDHVNFI